MVLNRIHKKINPNPEILIPTVVGVMSRYYITLTSKNIQISYLYMTGVLIIVTAVPLSVSIQFRGHLFTVLTFVRKNTDVSSVSRRAVIRRVRANK